MELSLPMRSFLSGLDQNARKPALRLILILNQYHSIGMMYGTSIQKDAFASRLAQEAKNAARPLPSHVRSQLDFWLTSKEVWEAARDRIHV